MYICVFLHVWLLMESFPTVRTWIWSGITVYEEMGGQGGRALERLTTLVTLKVKQNIYIINIVYSFNFRKKVTDIEYVWRCLCVNVFVAMFVKWSPTWIIVNIVFLLFFCNFIFWEKHTGANKVTYRINRHVKSLFIYQKIFQKFTYLCVNMIVFHKLISW